MLVIWQSEPVRMVESQSVKVVLHQWLETWPNDFLVFKKEVSDCQLWWF